MRATLLALSLASLLGCSSPATDPIGTSSELGSNLTPAEWAKAQANPWGITVAQPTVEGFKVMD